MRWIVIETQQKLKLIEQNILRELLLVDLDTETYELILLRTQPENEFHTFKIREISRKDNSIMILVKKEEKKAWIRIVEGHNAWITMMEIKNEHN